jgi:hypothetical protein
MTVGSTSLLPNIRERDALQRLLTGSWKSARELQPTSIRTLEKMIEKSWIEKCIEPDVLYKMTFAGRRAFETPLPIR